MNKNQIQNQNSSKINKFLKWNSRNRIKSSAVVFSVLVVGGTIIGGILLFMSRGAEEQTATNQVEAALTGQIPGWWFQENFGNSTCNADDCQPDADPDEDKLTNYQEYFYSSNPNSSDTNSNGNTDGEDVAFGYVPNKPGKITFEQAGSDESIVGESLLFNNEIKNVISGMSDLSKVALPEVDSAELKITQNNTQDGFTTYMTAIDNISRKYFNSESYSNLSEEIKQQDQGAIQKLKLTSLAVVNEYKMVEVPSDLVDMHKYQIAMWTVVPTVIEIPNSSSPLESMYDDSVNNWFDSAQAMIALNQKIKIEITKLRNKYEVK